MERCSQPRRSFLIRNTNDVSTGTCVRQMMRGRETRGGIDLDATLQCHRGDGLDTMVITTLRRPHRGRLERHLDGPFLQCMVGIYPKTSWDGFRRRGEGGPTRTAAASPITPVRRTSIRGFAFSECDTTSREKSISGTISVKRPARESTVFRDRRNRFYVPPYTTCPYILTSHYVSE